MELLPYLVFVAPYLVAMVLGVAIPFVCVAMVRSPAMGLVLYALAVLQAALVPDIPILSLGITLFFGDLVVIAMLGCTLLRYGGRLAGARAPAALAPFAAILLLSFILGLLQYKSAAGVALRPYLYCLVPAVYFGSFSFLSELLRPALKCLGSIGICLIAIAVLRWTGVLPMPGGDSITGEFAELEKTRTLNSGMTMILSQFGFALLIAAEDSKFLMNIRALTPIVFGIVLVLQHRSVWLATLAALFCRQLLGGKTKVSPVYVVALLAGLGAIAVTIMATGIGSSTVNLTINSAERALSTADTGQARLDTWAYVFQRYAGGGPSVWLIGFPFGTTMERLIVSHGSVRQVGFQSHNFYVQTLFNTGLLGVGSVIALLAWLGIESYRRLRLAEAKEPYQLVLVLLVGQMTYYMFYGFTLTNGLFMGLIIAATHSRVWVAHSAKSPAKTDDGRRGGILSVPRI
jgi:hypothetical protein